MALTRIPTEGIATGAVQATDIAAASITGQTAETSVQDADVILVYDNSATAIRKMTRGNFKADDAAAMALALGAYQMANTLTNASVAVGTSLTTLYEVPVSTSAVVHSLFLSNIHATDAITVGVAVRQATVRPNSSQQEVYIAKNVDVVKGSTLIFDKPINLATGDILKVIASAASKCEATASILEIT